MLFNSFTFIFLFLPVTFLGYLVIGSERPQWSALWLTAASLFFYGYWNPRYLPLLLISAAVNFCAGRTLATLPASGERKRRFVLFLAIAFNLALLAYFKYAGFLITTLTAISSLDVAIPHIILPLGISFFTFTQIAFLVDAFRGEAHEPKPINYLLFVTYFPHLIAGPILHHKEMMPQFANKETYRFNPRNLAAGSVVLIIGLFKKAVLADGIASYATPVFDAAARGQHFLMQDAWAGALAYTFQLYFDFSGYCDMAIGASLMFGIALPVNFNSPYKSLSITEFWRRWHMTLSRFLRDYLYIPLGGNRNGSVRRYINLMATMLLGGLWHGAGWTFVVWGGLHGLYLVINHVFVALRKRLGYNRRSRIGQGAAWTLTFVAVVFAWVVFRADSLSAALLIFSGMLQSGSCGSAASCSTSFFRYAPGMAAQVWIWCPLLLLAVIGMPNTQEIMRDYLGELTRPRGESSRFLGMPVVFQFTPGWALATGAMFAVAFACLPQPTSFLYFNF